VESTEDATYFVITSEDKIKVTAARYSINAQGALTFLSDGADVVMFSPDHWRYVYKEGSAERMERPQARRA